MTCDLSVRYQPRAGLARDSMDRGASWKNNRLVKDLKKATKGLRSFHPRSILSFGCPEASYTGDVVSRGRPFVFPYPFFHWHSEYVKRISCNRAKLEETGMFWRCPCLSWCWKGGWGRPTTASNSWNTTPIPARTLLFCIRVCPDWILLHPRVLPLICMQRWEHFIQVDSGYCTWVDQSKCEVLGRNLYRTYHKILPPRHLCACELLHLWALGKLEYGLRFIGEWRV